MCIINNINSLLKSFEYKIKKHEKNFRNNLNGYHNNDIFLTDSVKKLNPNFKIVLIILLNASTAKKFR
jgi:hypothetical protein